MTRAAAAVPQRFRAGDGRMHGSTSLRRLKLRE